MISEEVFANKIKSLLGSDTIILLETEMSSHEDYDSLFRMAVSAWFSRDFKIEISPNEIELLITFKDLFDFLNSKLNK